MTLAIDSVLAVVRGHGGTPAARRCVEALERAALLPMHETPTLRAFGEAAPELRHGAIVIAVLGLGAAPSAVHAYAARTAPRAFPNDRRAHTRAAELWGDCYLALADWLDTWNRNRF